MPFHYLLFHGIDIPAIVLTSGNISEEPIIKDNEVAISTFSTITDAVLTYNREIYNRIDDSVVSEINGQERIIRRSRGYVPTPFPMNINVEGILATGAELVNCFAIGKENKAIISQHIGDLKNLETFEFYCETIERYKKLFLFDPRIVVSDIHPDYLSTRYAVNSKLPHIEVQHHHAHIASCMAENKINEKVIGISFDGTGLGTDGNIWGSEFFICDLKDFLRVKHFEYVPMPGGDKAAEEPWRMAISYLYKYYGEKLFDINIPFLRKINNKSVELICHAIDKKINCPLTSGAGRLFDAVAALIDLCSINIFHAEAPMRLESAINKNIQSAYSFKIGNEISFEETFSQIISDIYKEESIALISTKFHNTIINVVIESVCEISKESGINSVVLSGGTFQNKYILGNIENRLEHKNFRVYSHKKIPTNDAGIAIGQMAIAAARISL